MKRFGRASRVEIHHHPDAGKQTVRMPFSQLRALVIAALDGEDDPEREFESAPTTYRPSQAPRTRTLDAVIASLSRDR